MGEYGYSAVGAVVGATYPQQAKAAARGYAAHVLSSCRATRRAQGAGADDVAVSFDKEGLGAIVNSSRAIMCAYKKQAMRNTLQKPQRMKRWI